METIRYGLLGREDIRHGMGTFTVQLADGREVTLSELDVRLISSTLAGLPTASTATAGRRTRVTDDNRGLRTDTGTIHSAEGRVFYADNFDFASTRTGAQNSAALQAAHDALPATGGTIVLPAGAFSLNGLVTLSKPSVRIIGQGPQATQLNATGSALKVEDTVDDLLFSLWLSDFALTEVSTSTTAIGIDVLSYVNRQAKIHRLELSGFGGGELRLRGGSNFEISNNYFSHNRAGGTGSALRIYENPTNGSATTFQLRANYFASTVAGAAAMVQIEDLVSGRFIGNIYENVPAGVVGFRAEKVNAALACDGLTFIGEHFEAISGTAWQLHDCTNTAIFGVFGATPALTWNTVAAINRYVVDMGSAGEPDLKTLRRALFGLSGPNDFSPNAAIQVGPIRGSTNAQMAQTLESATVGRSAIWEVWGNDTGGTRRQIGQAAITLNTAHASAPEGRYSVDTLDLGGTLTEKLAVLTPGDDETALLIRVDRGGVETVSRVTIGAVDSGGAGFRLLRVAN